ncbi:thiamine pyrophosphate-dependent enzyme [uncultured Marinobacter sp.]|uniref:thiamine pyrophosphate-dependent enzyme n=1 Tax=uncultured Marinobacter sp. TaxID=187379 RepID=UPI0030D80A01
MLLRCGPVTKQADVVITLGRRLYFQLGYGSPAVFGDACLLRIADNIAELCDKRRGVCEILATPVDALSGVLAAAGDDGLMHPSRLLAVLREVLPADAVVVADGGDLLSFARLGLPATTYLDPGSLGCIGVGTPFGVAAALACPGRVVLVVTGDGSFGFNGMEIDTAVCHQAPVLVVVANSGSWAIEARDQ